MPQIVTLMFLFLVTPTPAHAYVDPGFLGALYQLAYVFIFGTLAVWVMKPVQFIKSLFKGSKKQEPVESPEDSEPQ